MLAVHCTDCTDWRVYVFDYVLYRLLDDQGVLLYVGITDNFPRRLREHTRDKPWIYRVKRIELDDHNSWGSAQAAERRAIRTEKPTRNRQGNPHSVYAENDRLMAGRRFIRASEIKIKPGPKPWRRGEDPYGS